MTSKLVLALVVLGAAGCRSDGGVDRRDCQQGMSFALRSLARQTQEDIAETQAFVASVPSRLSHHTTESVKNLRGTYSLYLDTHAAH